MSLWERIKHALGIGTENTRPSSAKPTQEFVRDVEDWQAPSLPAPHAPAPLPDLTSSAQEPQRKDEAFSRSTVAALAQRGVGFIDLHHNILMILPKGKTFPDDFLRQAGVDLQSDTLDSDVKYNLPTCLRKELGIDDTPTINRNNGPIRAILSEFSAAGIDANAVELNFSGCRPGPDTSPQKMRRALANSGITLHESAEALIASMQARSK